MKVEVRDLCKPKDIDGTKYFQLLPTISVLNSNGTYHVYFAWFNICVHIH